MNFPPIVDGNTLLVSAAGNSLPDVSSAMGEWLIDMTFSKVGKVVGDAFELVETSNSTLFKGVKQPYKPSELEMERAGERAWDWFKIHSTTDLALAVDDMITIGSTLYRVMAAGFWGEYGFYEYKVVRDYQ